ncbi:ACT domain-containing protein [Acetatifactor aquisgranensis]|uniref:ACT domain-containing protein n=1 Tax=Acetatifactor aquisgranensis TaxID=2941233 RepID=UPI00203F2D1B|nr:ACT domain-containing protein [Acetatifactor aquisgranensis]MCI8788775.1 ACT domain-containing protein [Lachnospiraceae bacterium]
MTISQISVFLENKAGQLADITGILSEKQVNMRAISIAETADYGILRLIVDDAPKASSILLEQGFILTMTPVVGVEVPDTPGGLSKVLGIISRAGIDIEYMYSVFGQKDGQACMIFRVADADGLTALLAENGIATIAGEDLGVH